MPMPKKKQTELEKLTNFQIPTTYAFLKTLEVGNLICFIRDRALSLLATNLTDDTPSLTGSAALIELISRSHQQLEMISKLHGTSPTDTKEDVAKAEEKVLGWRDNEFFVKFDLPEYDDKLRI